MRQRAINPFHLPPGTFHPDPHAGSYSFGRLAPPWKNADGPSSYAGYEKARERYLFSIYGGGLWDFDCEPIAVGRHTTPQGRGAVQSNAIDQDLLKAYAQENHVQGRQYDVYLLAVHQGVSLRRTAAMLGMTRQAAQTLIKRLHVKARRWATLTPSNDRSGVG